MGAGLEEASAPGTAGEGDALGMEEGETTLPFVIIPPSSFPAEGMSVLPSTVPWGMTAMVGAGLEVTCASFMFPQAQRHIASNKAQKYAVFFIIVLRYNRKISAEALYPCE